MEKKTLYLGSMYVDTQKKILLTKLNDNSFDEVCDYQYKMILLTTW